MRAASFVAAGAFSRSSSVLSSTGDSGSGIVRHFATRPESGADPVLRIRRASDWSDAARCPILIRDPGVSMP